MMLHTTDSAEARRALLAKYLRGGLSQETKETIPSYSSSRPAPLSFGQQQLWLFAQLVPDEPVYNECVTIHLPGPLAIAVFERSFNEIIRRHEAWRTSFPLVDGQPVQMVHPPAPIALPVVDLLSLPVSEREAEALRLATEDARILFDMAQGPLLRAKLIRLGEQEHRLFLTLHHIIFDGVAIYQVFLPELRTIYEAFLAGQPSPLPPATIKYTDYAWWQREWLEKEVFADQMVYWRRQLAGAAATLELPTDRPRPAVQTYHGSMFPFALSKELTNALQTLAGQEGATLYMILVAAFKRLLYRYTGQEDMLVGTATAGRNRVQLQRLMGFCLSTVVLRTNLSGDPTFRELLKRVREVVAAACAHDDVAFEYVVKELHPDRSLDHNPLFQVLITLEPPLPILASGWTLTQMDVKTGTSKFDLSLELDNRPEGLIGRFEFNTDLFDESTIARMIGHWKTLLEGIIADPSQRLSELPILTQTEYRQLLEEWNATQADYPMQKCIHQLFEAQVAQSPDAVAAIFGQTCLTYRELNQQANRLGHRLQEMGVEPDKLVGLCVERSLEMIVGMLGILKAGGAYVPLDPTYPTERLSYMLEDSHATVLVTQHHLVERLSLHDIQVIRMDADASKLALQPDANFASPVAPNNLAYVIYTSGSTGRPKGVQIHQRAVVNFLTSMRQQPGMSKEDTLLAVTTFSFDIAALELFLPLLVGARLVVAESNVIADGKALIETIASSHATVMQATPVTWRMLLATGWQGNRQLKVLCGGEALPRELVQQLLPKVASLWNMYGPTETTIWSTICKIELEDEVVSIGRPIANTQVYLLDTCLHPVPVGVPGELYIGGDGLATGYLNRPELTAERFIPHPFSTRLGARLYKTGDLARYRADGIIELIGRLDHQVKLRGFRIELGEIEAVLEKHPDVRQVVVVVREDVTGDKRLVAYVVPQHQHSPTDSELRRCLQEHLPDYMIPSTFLLLKSLPLTLNGKVDRRALPASNVDRSEKGATFVAPTLTIHHHFIHIWEDLLDIRPIGIRDNFFDLGGHSITAIRLVHQIEQVFGKRIPVSTLYTRPTIEQLANVLTQQGNEEEQTNSRTPLVAVQAAGSKRPFFLLHGNWFGTAFYCFPLAAHLGTDQPLYALDPYKFDGQQAPPTLEVMAAAHIEALRAVQPNGPYLLGGFCNGGLLAYEMARQLHAQKQKVELLVLMDPMALPHGYPAYHKLLRRAIHHIGNLLQLSPDKQLSFFIRMRHILRTSYTYLQGLRYKRVKNVGSQRTDEQVEFGHKRSKTRFALPQLDAMILTDDALPQDYGGILDWVVLGYRPPNTYPGTVTFFWPSEERWHCRSWHQVAEVTEVEEYFVPGTQLTWKTEHLSDLSECLQKCLDKVQEVVAIRKA